VRERHQRLVEQQEGIEIARPGKAEKLEDERDEEREEGISAERRGSAPAPSDRPENSPPHPQDTNEIGSL
jgi:hypothetical protein